MKVFPVKYMFSNLKFPDWMENKAVFIGFY